MSEDDEPKRVFYGLKPRDFERLNTPGQTGDGDASHDVRDLARIAAAGQPPATPSAPPENEVHAILRGNLAQEKAAGANDLKPMPRRRSRRRRDYILLMIVGNAALIPSLLFSTVLGLAGLVLFNLSLTWVFWQVMSDY